ncbi:MAG: hypothetical protein EU530_11780 [Promethearchaeota archaeon]|nr:MAG: hypothetical protein EU530_11780 [Candidatus Lokiarchaeota archaeon]
MSPDHIGQFEHFDEIDSPEFERHDKHNFEVALDYLIDSKKDKNIFMLEMFGFIPNSLQINEQTYSQSNFYNDTRILTRYKTPKISLKTLINPNKSRSPLNRIDSYLESPEETSSKLKYEIRMLGAISRVNIRDGLNIYASLLNLNSEHNFDEKQFMKFVSRVKTLKRMLHELYEKIIHSPLTIEIKNAFSFMAQFVFVQIELRFSKFIGKVESPISEHIRELIINLIDETKEEKKHFQPTINLDFTESGERFEHSEGLLKKFNQRVLYLEQIRKKKENQVKQLAYSIAAGVAMVVSILLTFLIVYQFPQNSLPFVIGLILVYMFKDRIKFFFQWLSKKTLRIFIADRTHKLYDAYEKTEIGTIRETMRFLVKSEIPDEIALLRDLERSEIEHQENLETVFFYKKIMQLRVSTLSKIHNRVKNVHDIVRFNIRNFIQYADDPFKEYPVIDREMGDKLKTVKQYKVYHLNLIFRISRLKSKKYKESIFKRVRIILDQDGIKRLEYPKVQ